MHFRNIALANLKVRKVKTFFLILGVFFGVAAVITLSSVAGSLRQELEQQLAENGLKLLILPYSEELSLSYRGIPVAGELAYSSQKLPVDIVASLEDNFSGEGTVIVPRIAGTVKLNGAQTMVVGIVPEMESVSKPWWQVSSGNLPEDGELLLGNSLALTTGLRPGAVVQLDGTEAIISGILAETGQPDDQMGFTTDTTAFSVLQSESYSFIELLLPGMKDSQAEEALINRLRAQFSTTEIVRVEGELSARRQVAENFFRIALVISILTLLASMMIVLVTMMGSIQERVQEIGTFRAIGYRRTHIARIILTEAFAVGMTGGATGYLAGLFLSVPAGQFLADVTVRLTFRPTLLLTALVVAAGISGLASLYPAHRAANLDPIEALRQ